VEFSPDTLSGLMASAVVDDPDIASWEVRQCPYEHPKYYDPVTLETSWSSHACILIRKDAYVQVGGYEEKIFMYGEDVELSYRFRANGYRLRYLPHVVARHFIDFDNPEIRPRQLSGSLSANVLLRYRYGGAKVGQHGEALLNAAHGQASSRNAKAFQDAVETVERDKTHYQTVHRPSHRGIFPFNGFDYELTRLGHDWEVDSLTPPLEQPLVSIITRTHGGNPKILREAMASVLNQTYSHLEHIIVEDRTDFAQEMVKETARSYGADIRYIRSERGGRSPAANTGLEVAKGDLLLFLDNDDLLFSDHVETLVRGLQDNPEAVAAYSMSWEVPTYFSGGGGYREGHFTVPEPFTQPYSAERFKKGNFLPIQSVLFRKQLFIDEGGIDESIDHLEDWNLWARYARYGSFAKIDKLTSFFRIPGDPVFQTQRQAIMLEAEDAVWLKTFGG
jgi:GT2 family glycosyltransferase